MSKLIAAYKLNSFIAELNTKFATGEISYAAHHCAVVDYKIANGLN